MSRPKFEDLGKLLLRITICGLLLLHGINKMRHGIGPIHEMAIAKGLPSFIAYGVYIGEIVAPIFALVGFGARIAGLIIAFNMVIAIYLGHGGQTFLLGKGGGSAIELDLLYMFGGLVIALLGAGRWSVTRGKGRFD